MHLTTPYQINKMTGEMYCNFYNHHYGLPIVNCRFFNSYCPGEAPGQYSNGRGNPGLYLCVGPCAGIDKSRLLPECGRGELQPGLRSRDQD